MAQARLGLEMCYTYPEKCIFPWFCNLWMGIQEGENISRHIPILLDDSHLVIARSCMTSPGISLFHWCSVNLPNVTIYGLELAFAYLTGKVCLDSLLGLFSVIDNIIIINQECIILNASFMPEKLPNFKKFSCLSQPSVWSRWMSPWAHNSACYHSRTESYLEQHSRSASSVSSNY